MPRTNREDVGGRRQVSTRRGGGTVDTAGLKPAARKGIRVRVPSSALPPFPLPLFDPAWDDETKKAWFAAYDRLFLRPPL